MHLSPQSSICGKTPKWQFRSALVPHLQCKRSNKLLIFHVHIKNRKFNLDSKELSIP